MKWQPGMRVKNKPELGHLYEGTPWADKLSKPRGGTVVAVPWFAENTGSGTIKVEWDSLTGTKNKGSDWSMWTHTEFILPDPPKEGE